jgi:monoamine oxidase
MPGGTAADVLARARAAAAYARRTGCGIAEATQQAAGVTGRRGGEVSRRAVLGGAAAALIAGTGARPASRAAPRSSQRVVIVGAGIAGLGCAFRLWRDHGIRSEIYEFNPRRIGGRIVTLHGFFDGGQYAEQHGEFISSEHTQMRRLAARLGLTPDNVNRYPAHTRALDYRLRLGGRFWPQAALNRDWHE